MLYDFGANFVEKLSFCEKFVCVKFFFKLVEVFVYVGEIVTKWLLLAWDAEVV